MTGVGVRVERLFCPIGTCPWTHDREAPTEATHTFEPGKSPLHDGPAATLQEAIADAALATLMVDALEVEGAVKAHLETHPLEDWVREVMRLRAERPTWWPREQRIPLVTVGQTYPFGYQPEWWQAVEEYHRSTHTAKVAPAALTAAGINEALEWWNERADRLLRGADG